MSNVPREEHAMPKTPVELYAAVMDLNADDYDKFLELFYSQPNSAPRLHSAWGPELRRRAAELDSGEVVGVPWDEVCDKAEQILNDAEDENA
jgi:Putative addiction module component